MILLEVERCFDDLKLCLWTSFSRRVASQSGARRGAWKFKRFEGLKTTVEQPVASK